MTVRRGWSPSPVLEPASGGAGGGAGAGAAELAARAPGACGWGSAWLAQPATRSRRSPIARCSVFVHAFLRRFEARAAVEQPGSPLGIPQNAHSLKVLFLLPTYSATEGHDYSAAIFETDERSFADPRFPSDPHMRNVLAPRRIHQMRDGSNGGQARLLESDRAQVGETFPARATR